MRSIQTRLVVGLLACILAMSAAGTVAVYTVFREDLTRQFDDGLRAEARYISTFFVRDHDGRYEFNPPADIDSLFHHGNDIDVFCIRRMDGTVAARSRGLDASQCPGALLGSGFEGFARVDGSGHRHLRDFRRHRERGHLLRSLLPHEGNSWRAAFLTFLPVSETGAPTERFQIAVAAEWQESGALLRHLLRVLLLVSAVAGTVTVLLVVWTVRRGLRPLRDLAHQAAGIGTANLDARFSIAGAASELVPIQRALNDLLERMEDALKREQRFNADVAHELRTPVSELRSLCEVALANPDAETATEALRDAREIGAQMEAMIASLLALRRSQSPVLRRLDVTEVASQTWGDFAPLAEGRFRVSLSPEGEMPARCDPTMLSAVLRNLFENAIAYTAAGGEIAYTIARRGAVVEITVRNRPHGLAPDDIPHLLEPFWRKETARSDGTHAGLGLALAETYCRGFGGALRAELSEDGWLVFTVSVPAEA